MARNLILCSDGTGNKGGSTPDSNVFKIFNAVDIHTQGSLQQLTFYDNGVGTSTNRVLKMLGGGLGLGFKENICDLYRFLARNYQSGDNVYLFGFSRGAATIRAFTGFIGCCGLLDNKGPDGKALTEAQLDENIEALYKKYVKSNSDSRAPKPGEDEENLGAIDIRFVGVWDTVAALGFPKGTDVLGPVSWLMNWLFVGLDNMSDYFKPHKFYRYELYDNITHAYHAIALDDERTAFKPLIWNEEKRKEGSVEQVWFAGMHSNVGGGYARDGLAYIPLYWMMTHARKCGLRFKQGALDQCYASSNPQGYIYNSRAGTTIIYRYHPREIEKLCAEQDVGDILVHRSVIERMKHRTANYAPSYLPGHFSVTESITPTAKAGDIKNIALSPGSSKDWLAARAEVDTAVKNGKYCYMVMVVAMLTIIVLAIRFWTVSEITAADPSYPFALAFKHLSEVLTWIFPIMFKSLIQETVYHQPLWLLGAGAFGYTLWSFVKKFRKAKKSASVSLRNIVLRQPGL